MSALQHSNLASIRVLQPVFPLQPNVPPFVEEFGTANLRILQSLHLKVFLGKLHNCLLEIWAVYFLTVY